MEIMSVSNHTYLFHLVLLLYITAPHFLGYLYHAIIIIIVVTSMVQKGRQYYE